LHALSAVEMSSEWPSVSRAETNQQNQEFLKVKMTAIDKKKN